MRRICSVEGCEKRRSAHGYCKKHLWRWQQNGDPLISQRLRNEGPCEIEGCERNSYKRGMCNPHYIRCRRHGDPLHGGDIASGRHPPSKHGEAEEYARRLAETCEDRECVTWPYARTPHGYGTIGGNGNTQWAHRFICELVHGPPPTPDHEAAHSCGKGNEGCVNPNHLRWATHAENQADRVLHGTSNRGERCAASKLTEDQVRTIRAMKGQATQAEIGRHFGVSRESIRHIHSGRNWGWLQ